MTEVDKMAIVAPQEQLVPCSNAEALTAVPVVRDVSKSHGAHVAPPWANLSLCAGWLQGPQVRQVPTPNFNQRPQQEISLIVMHCIALPPHNFGGPYIDQLFTRTLNPTEHPYFKDIAPLELSTHLFINRQGKITQYVSFLDRAWHAGRSSYQGQKECNDFGIGIELEGTDDSAYTDEQYAALNAILPLLYQAYPDIKERVASHSEVAPQRKTDPGPYFDYTRIGLRC